MASLRLPLFLRPRCSSFFALLPWPSWQSKDGGHLLPILSFLGHFHFIELQSMCLACREGEYHNRWWSPLLAQVGSGLALCVPWKAMKVSYLSSVKLLCFFSDEEYVGKKSFAIHFSSINQALCWWWLYASWLTQIFTPGCPNPTSSRATFFPTTETPEKWDSFFNVITDKMFFFKSCSVYNTMKYLALNGLLWQPACLDTVILQGKTAITVFRDKPT